MIAHTSQAGLSIVLSANLQQVEQAIIASLQYLDAKQGTGTKRFAVELMLREFLNNAVIHGSRFDPTKRVFLSCSVGKKYIHLHIRDEGPGFPWRLQAAQSPEPDATSGRGIPLAKLYCCMVRFNQRGNEITLKIEKE